MFSFSEDFLSTNSADPDEMLHLAAFHLGLHCLPTHKNFIKHFQTNKLKMDYIENLLQLKHASALQGSPIPHTERKHKNIC